MGTNLPESDLHCAIDSQSFVRSDRYDLIFLDPPYRQAERWAADLSALVPTVLATGGRVVTESDRRSPLDLELTLIDERRYGDTLIRIHTHAH